MRRLMNNTVLLSEAKHPATSIARAIAIGPKTPGASIPVENSFAIEVAGFFASLGMTFVRSHLALKT
jgi:hypothetical protein